MNVATAQLAPHRRTALGRPLAFAFATVVLPAMLYLAVRELEPWIAMIVMGLGVLVGSKAVSLAMSWDAVARAGVTHARPHAWRLIVYLLLYPGMNARAFLLERAAPTAARDMARQSGPALLKLLVGIGLFWIVPRVIVPSASDASGHAADASTIAAAWAGMIGFVLIFHFGLLDLTARLLRAAGFKAEPVMDRPARSTSLAEFWGARWNLPFREMAHMCIFVPLVRRIGPGGAMLAVFAASGLTHDVVISLSAQAGFGLPTAYFLMQGAGVSVERSRLGRRLGLGRGVRGRLFTALLTIGPLYWLFHPWFVARVAMPMMRDLGAL